MSMLEDQKSDLESDSSNLDLSSDFDNDNSEGNRGIMPFLYEPQWSTSESDSTHSQTDSECEDMSQRIGNTDW